MQGGGGGGSSGSGGGGGAGSSGPSSGGGKPRARIQNASRNEKTDQFWSSVEKEKLDTLKYVLLHSGINTVALQNDDGLTAVQVAAVGGKAKALLLMLDIMRQQRCLKEAVDVATEEEGKTALMLAAEKGHVKCVDHLLYYGASKTLKCLAGRTARDYAAARKAPGELLELFDEDVEDSSSSSSTGGGAAEAADADGLTSTQRSKLKKKAMKDAEQKGLLAAIAAAADKGAAGAAAEGGEGEGGGGAAAALGPHGLPPLPKPAPTPAWPELTAAYLDAAKVAQAKRELRLERRTLDNNDAGDVAQSAVLQGGGGSSASASASASSAECSSVPLSSVPLSDGTLDPSVWHLSLLNRLELHIPGLERLSPLVGHLSALQTLIVSGCGLLALPDTLGCLAELKYLQVQRNALTALPASLASLKRLEVVDVSDNCLPSLGPLGALTSLTTVLADRNALEEVALDFAGLARLETLSLSGNRLKALPEDIGLPQLFAVLNVADNELTGLPKGLASMKEKKIRELKLLPNPFEDPKIRKVLAKEDRVEMVKELFKLLAKQAGGGKGKK